MCGIAGGFGVALGAAAPSRDVVAALNHWQRRRGPDGEGSWSSPDGQVVLGHRRLAVIETGSGGAQPMSDATGRWTISFNGEIYNYRQLRAALEEEGCRFRTNSDTEVLINVVAYWGETGLLRLRGMYAFALWDAEDRELWLARDPYGVKPLYYAEGGGCVWFASQARALASCAPVDRRLDPAGIVGFYLWGYVPEPFSWWRNIRLLPAGHLLRIPAGKPVPPPREYASIQEAYINRPMPPLTRAELHDILLASVRSHLVADVPVGLFLSSGIDSTVLASLVTELSAPLRTITLAFDEYIGTPQDEAPLAEETARRLGAQHMTVRVSRDGFEERLNDFLDNMDQPTTDGLNTFLVSEAAASQGLKVALSGLGGDELFGGYPSFHQIPKLLAMLRHLPRVRHLRPPRIHRIGKLLPRAIPPKWTGLFSHSGDLAHAYLLRRALHLEIELEDFLDAEMLREGLERLGIIDAVARSVDILTEAEASAYARIAALEAGWYMRNQLLRDTDWASMAHSVEVRVPFVDMQLLQRIGPAIASSAPPTKMDLAACAVRVPASITDRAKTGFTTPVNLWIRQTTGVSARGLRGWASYLVQRFSDEWQGASAMSSVRNAAPAS